ncbi:MAG: hypothetical protein ACLFR1_08420 [Spirochaetia bacterium]
MEQQHDLEFIKVRIAGNDQLLLNCIHSPGFTDEELAFLAEYICRRKRGVGARGIIVIESIDNTTQIRCFTKRGDPVTPYGDQLLIAARFLFDSGYFHQDTVTINTKDTSHTVTALDSHTFLVKLGTPYSLDQDTPVTPYDEKDLLVPANIEGFPIINYTGIRIGKPVCVIHYENKPKSELKKLTTALASSQRFPKEALPAFVTVYSREELKCSAWNSQNSLDISTTAAAAGISSCVHGFADPETTIQFNDAKLYFEWKVRSNEVYIAASPEYVFSGRFEILFPEH